MKRILKFANRFFYQNFGFIVSTVGMVWNLRSVRFESLLFRRRKGVKIEVSDVVTYPSWSWGKGWKLKFSFSRLKWKEGEVKDGDGILEWDGGQLRFEITGDFQSILVHFILQSAEAESVDKARAIKAFITIQSVTYNPQTFDSGSLLFKILPPFSGELSVVDDNFDFESFDLFSLDKCSGQFESKGLQLDYAITPEFRTRWEKNAENQFEFNVFSPDKTGINGFVHIFKAKKLQLKSELEIESNLFSRYMEEYQSISDFNAKDKLSLKINGKANQWNELIDCLKIKGNFAVRPVKQNLMEYKPFKGKFSIDEHQFLLNIPQVKINGGVILLSYQEVFDENWKMELNIEGVEVWPYFQSVDQKLGFSGLTTGHIIHQKNGKDPIEENYQLEITGGELFGRQEMFDSLLPWKELQEIRRQLLHVEGFIYFTIDVVKSGESYAINMIDLKGKHQQRLSVKGTLSDEKEVDVIIDASFIGFVSLILHVFGPYRRPVILPATGKMAERFVQSSNKTAKKVVGVLKDLLPY